jgi:hypothetical protein
MRAVCMGLPVAFPQVETHAVFRRLSKSRLNTA